VTDVLKKDSIFRYECEFAAGDQTSSFTPNRISDKDTKVSLSLMSDVLL
jgi:hypothetical protein